MDELIYLITNSLRMDKCVLVLGPDLYVKEMNGSLVERKQRFSEIEDEVKNCIYFPNEDVFHVEQKSEFAIRDKLQKFYTGGGDHSLFELIATVKFPLIINVSPDSTFKEFCDDNEVPLECKVFAGSIDEKQEVEFSADKPLMYNILGNTRTQQIIVNHKQLFEYMQLLLPENSFPEAIRTYLINSNCFVFLGFKFNSWVFQLISHKILSYIPDRPSKKVFDQRNLRLSHSQLNRDRLSAIEEGKMNNTIKSSNMDAENMVNIIMSSSVDMEFTDATPAQLMSQVIKSLQENGLTDFTRNIKNQEKYVSYLSYAHAHEGDSSPNIGTVASMLVNSFTDEAADEVHLKIVHDVAHLHFGQSIDSFMTRIGKGKLVVMIVSDKYLKSVYCMTEATRILRYNNEDERIFAIVIRDGLAKAEDYENYWREEAKMLIDTKKSKGEEIARALEFADGMSVLFAKLNNIKYLPVDLADLTATEAGAFVFEKEKQEQFDGFIRDLISKLKG